MLPGPFDRRRLRARARAGVHNDGKRHRHENIFYHFDFLFGVWRPKFGCLSLLKTAPVYTKTEKIASKKNAKKARQTILSVDRHDCLSHIQRTTGLLGLSQNM